MLDEKHLEEAIRLSAHRRRPSTSPAGLIGANRASLDAHAGLHTVRLSTPTVDHRGGRAWLTDVLCRAHRRKGLV